MNAVAAASRSRRAVPVIVAALLMIAVGALSANVGADQATQRRQIAAGPTASWVAPTTTAAPPTTSAPAPKVVLPTLVPASAPFSSYFDGTLRLRNLQAASLGVGTAFVVGDGTWALTNRHVVADSVILSVETWDGEALGDAQVVALGPSTTDLALLRLPGVVPGALRLSTEELAEGTELVAGGYPRAAQFTRSIGKYMSSSTQSGMEMLLTSVPAAPGSSGSPLLNPAGEVVGIIFGGSYSGYTLAVPASEAVALLATQQLQG